MLLESLRIALQSLVANPLRSLLTLIGIAVGIGAVLHVVSLGRVTQQRINARLETLGTNVLVIRPGFSQWRGVRTGESVTTLTWDQAREIEAASAVIPRTVPVFSQQAEAEFRDRNRSTGITGTTSDFFQVNNETLERGRAFTDRELEQRARVAVLGASIRDEFFDGGDPLGAEILIDSQRFAVVGTLAAKGEGWWSPDERILIPLTTAQQRLFGADHVTSILCQTRRSEDFEEALFDIETILRRDHRLRPDQENDFQVFRQGFFLETIQDTNREIANFLILIAGISLLVGGLGIANVMLVSVTERIREIGIRRSIGANRLHILVQFLSESIALGLVGGALGVLGGLAFNRFQLGAGADFAWDWAGYSFAICAGIGLVAGMYPATQAAYKNVLDALRYE